MGVLSSKGSTALFLILLFVVGLDAFAQGAAGVARPLDVGAASGQEDCAAVHAVWELKCQEAHASDSCKVVIEGEAPPSYCNLVGCLNAAQDEADRCLRAVIAKSQQNATNSTGLQEQLVVPPGDNVPIPSRRPPRGSNKKPAAGSPKGSPITAGTDTNDYSMEALQQEVSACQENEKQANRCCTQPDQCGSSSAQNSFIPPPSSEDPESIRQYCAQLKNSSQQGRSSNADAAGVCYSSYRGCSMVCDKSKQKWQSYVPQCRSPQCDTSRVQQAISIFSSKSTECQRYQSYEQALSQQSGENFNTARQSQYCEKQSSLDPSSMMGGDDQQKANSDQQDCSGANAMKPECVDCSKYPNSPLCGGGNLVGSSNSDVDGVESGSGGGLSEFNVTPPPTEGLPSFPDYKSVEAKAQDAKAIPNGGGGGAMGSGSAGGSGFENPSGEGGEAGGYNTDILSGERGGGGGGAMGSASTGAGGSGFSGYGGRGSEEFKNKYGGVDLKQYLPGGAKDPNRSLASVGSTGTGHADISPAGVSMFNKITLRLTLKCKLKQLLGCE